MRQRLVVVGDEQDFVAAMVFVTSSGRSTVVKLTSDPTNRLAESIDACTRDLKGLEKSVLGAVAD